MISHDYIISYACQRQQQTTLKPGQTVFFQWPLTVRERADFILICAEMTRCSGGRITEGDWWGLVQSQEKHYRKWGGDVGPQDNHMGLLTGASEVKLLSSHRVWGRALLLQLWTDCFWQPWVFAARHLKGDTVETCPWKVGKCVSVRVFIGQVWDLSKERAQRSLASVCSRRKSLLCMYTILC